jgi:hypothetical protein
MAAYYIMLDTFLIPVKLLKSLSGVDPRNGDWGKTGINQDISGISEDKWQQFACSSLVVLVFSPEFFDQEAFFEADANEKYRY